MLNLISALPISPKESPSLPRQSQGKPLTRADQPFAQWLANSCCDRDRPPRKENPRANGAEPAEIWPDDLNPMAEDSANQPPVDSGFATLTADESADSSQIADDQAHPESETAPDPLFGEAQDDVLLDGPPPAGSSETALSDKPQAVPIPDGAATSAQSPLKTASTHADLASDQKPAPQDADPGKDQAQEMNPDPTTARLTGPETAATPESEGDLPAVCESADAELDRDPQAEITPGSTESSTASEPQPDAEMEMTLRAEITPVSTPSPAAPSAHQDPESQLPNASSSLDGDEAGVVPLRAADSSEGSGSEAESRSFQSHADLLTSAIAQGQTSPEPSAAPAAPPTAAPPPPAGGPLPQYMQPATLAENLDRIVLHSVRADPHSIRIDLEPASLGRVMVLCRETKEGLNVEIAVQSGQIRSLLAAQEHDLRQSLEAQGLHLGRFSVTCRDGDGRPDGERAGPQQQDHESAETENRRAEAEPATGPAPGSERGMRIGMRNRWVA